jgi:hypothetical protein
MALVFILGAGASHFAGYPLGVELWSFIKDKTTDSVAKERANAVIRDIVRVIQVLPPHEFNKPDLEQLFTLLDLAEAGTEPLELVKLDWPSRRLELMAMIADAFLWHEYCLQDRLRESGVMARVLDGWASQLRQGDVIVTFNWDLLHEVALWRRGKWHYADGYGFTSRDAPSGSRSDLKMLKLHGSVNWGQRDERDCEPSIEYKEQFFFGANDDIDYTRPTERNDGRYLIIPSYLKDTSSNRLLLSLWNQAFDALSSADQVTVIGFQLHPADALARQLIGCALTRNPNQFAIQIVAPGGPNHWEEFCFGIGRDYDQVRMKFEDWVLKEQE